MIEERLANLTGESSDQENIRAAIYARTSSLKQRFGHSLDEQVQLCGERAQLLGWNVAFVFRDEAESGKDTERPMFQAMRREVSQERFEVLIVWKLDRLSRSLLHAVQIESELQKNDVALYSVTEQIDTTTSAGRFNFRNLASAAEFERDMIKERSQMGLKARISEGRWPNRDPPLGYELSEDDSLEVKPDDASLVRRICTRYLEIRSMPQVAHELNEQGISTRKKNKWTARAVRDILTNEVYIGKYSAAGIDKQSENYRIISDEMFHQITQTRHRFQTKGASRQPMESERREQSVERVLDQYRSYLSAAT